MLAAHPLAGLGLPGTRRSGGDHSSSIRPWAFARKAGWISVRTPISAHDMMLSMHRVRPLWSWMSQKSMASHKHVMPPLFGSLICAKTKQQKPVETRPLKSVHFPRAVPRERW